jgi:hypothetical protein
MPTATHVALVGLGVDQESDPNEEMKICLSNIARKNSKPSNKRRCTNSCYSNINLSTAKNTTFVANVLKQTEKSEHMSRIRSRARVPARASFAFHLLKRTGNAASLMSSLSSLDSETKSSAYILTSSASTMTTSSSSTIATPATVAERTAGAAAGIVAEAFKDDDRGTEDDDDDVDEDDDVVFLLDLLLLDDDFDDFFSTFETGVSMLCSRRHAANALSTSLCASA